MEFLKELESYIECGEYEKALTHCNIVSECLGIRNEVIQLTSRLSRLKKRSMNSTITYENEVITENQIIQSLIYLKDCIKLQDTQLNKCLTNKYPKSLSDEILSALELILKLVGAILDENTKTLTNYFTGEESPNDIIKKMISLYHKQGNRRNFTEWITILEDFSQLSSDQIQEEVQILIKELRSLTLTLYSDDRVDLSPERMIKFQKQVDDELLRQDEIRKFHITILDRFPPEKREIVVSTYLNCLRTSLDNITICYVKIKRLLS